MYYIVYTLFIFDAVSWSTSCLFLFSSRHANYLLLLEDKQINSSSSGIICFGTLYLSCLLRPKRLSQLKETLFDIFRITSAKAPNLYYVALFNVGGKSGFVSLRLYKIIWLIIILKEYICLKHLVVQILGTWYTFYGNTQIPLCYFLFVFFP